MLHDVHPVNMESECRMPNVKRLRLTVAHTNLPGRTAGREHAKRKNRYKFIEIEIEAFLITTGCYTLIFTIKCAIELKIWHTN